MDEQKSLVHHIAEALERYRAERRATAPEDTRPRQPGRWGRVLRWFIPNGGTLLLVAMLVLTANAWARPLLSPAAAPGPSATTVNYQGRLADHSGNPLDGTYGMAFSLWDAATGGNLVWGPESYAAVPVSQGLFSVGLGSQTSGGIPTNVWNGDRYLQITVGGETLAPRELIRAVPIAGMALTVPDGAITSSKLAPTIAIDNENYVETTTESTAFQKLQQVSITLDHTSALLFSWQSHVSNSNDANYMGGDFHVYLDGALAEGGVLRTHYEAAANRVQPINIVGVIENVSPGVHTVEVWWKARYGGTLTSWARQLSVIVFGQ